MNLYEFQEAVKNDASFKNSLTGCKDVIDFDNGTALIYSENIMKYLEKYACKDADDLCDTLWRAYGVFVKIV